MTRIVSRFPSIIKFTSPSSNADSTFVLISFSSNLSSSEHYQQMVRITVYIELLTSDESEYVVESQYQAQRLISQCRN